MKILYRLTVLLLIICSSFANNASAKTVYMVQLGSFEDEQKARDHWNVLLAALPEIFTPLTYKPSKIVTASNDIIFHRVMGGPIKNRNAADDICSDVLLAGFECYVVETAMISGNEKNKEKSVQTQSSKDEIATKKTITYVKKDQRKADEASVVATTSPSPFKMSNDKWSEINANSSIANPTTAKIAAKPSPSDAIQDISKSTDSLAARKIEIAEAVPVPLSKMGQKTRRSGKTRRNYQSHRSTPLWAEISAFSSQNGAINYWRILRSRVNNIKLSGLRLRITRPFSSKNKARNYSLRVGPFYNYRDIRRLCSYVNKRKISCKAIRELGSAVKINKFRKMEKMNKLRIRGLEKYYKDTRKGKYWVHLGSFSNPRSAIKRWRSLKVKYANILGKLKENIALPNHQGYSRKKYRLRVGMFFNLRAAEEVCNELHKAGASCIAIASR